MTARAKICGLSTPEAIDAAVGGGASHIGLVFFPPSPRNVAPDRAGALAAAVPDRVARVGVFVDPDDTLLDRSIGTARLDIIQLHRTAPARAAAIRARFRRPVWCTVAIKTHADLETSSVYREAADRIVYDAKTPDGAALPGGMGLRFDWSLLAGFAHPRPWVLSGGLDAANVGEAIERTGAALVDVSSGVEGAPGLKDPARIAAFLAAVAAT